MHFDVLADIAGCLGLLLSVFTLFIGAVKNRESFDLNVIDYSTPLYTAQFLVSIVNRSKRPLVITEITFSGISCELEPKRIRGEPTAWNGATTCRFPLCVNPGSADFVYIEFVASERMSLIADTWVTFQIQTTHQQVLKTVLLGSTSHYLHRRK